MPLGGGDAVRLTIAKYFTPSGRSIQKPYFNNNRKDYYEDLNNRFENGEMADEKNPIIDSLVQNAKRKNCLEVLFQILIFQTKILKRTVE